MKARILHLSDLHFGVGWSRSHWDSMVGWAERFGPDLILVTGDLVNSPYRRTLAVAVAALLELQERVSRSSGRRCRVVAVPGNHDTRVLGNVPLRWITASVPVLWLVAAAVGYRWGLGWPAAVLGGLAVAASIYRGVLQSFWRACGDLAPRAPLVIPKLELIVFPYDSATSRLASARGVVPAGQFVPDVVEADARGYFRLAAVHHHPLPIPYDSQHEPLLVLDNAGAFLNEVSRKRIRLVLHGHKHHPNYARCSIRLGTSDTFEVGVLASGTTSAGRDPGPSGLNFHTLELSDETGVWMTPHSAPTGGTFAAGPRFSAEAPLLWASRRFEASRDGAGFEYAAVSSVWEVNADGDVRTHAEHRDFRIVRDGTTLTELPEPVHADTVTGHIERLTAGPVSRRGAAAIRLLIDKQDPRAYSLASQAGRLSFGRTIGVDQSLSYFVSYDTLNGCAITREQCRQMYSDTDAPVEWLGIKLQVIPSRDLLLVVHLPPECEVDGDPELVVEDARERARVQQLNADLLHDREAGFIIARVPYPILGVEYRIQWRLAEAGSPEVPPLVAGQARRLADGLLALPRPSPPGSRVSALVQGLVSLAGRHLQLAADDAPEVYLMVYDQAERALRVVAGSFDAADPRWQWRLRYGNGIAGRAFKTNRARLFVKERAFRLGTPLYYVPVSGRPVRDAADIPEAVILALPLSHPRDPRVVWGVLNVSSARADSRLVELTEDDTRKNDFWAAANAACFTVLAAVSSSSEK